MYRIIQGYLNRLPGAIKKEQLKEGTEVEHCIYSPNSLRATTATLLLDAGVDIRKVQDLLGHRHITTTKIYDKGGIYTSQRASHDVPIWLFFSRQFPFYQFLMAVRPFIIKYKRMNKTLRSALLPRCAHCRAALSECPDLKFEDWIVRCFACGAKKVLAVGVARQIDFNTLNWVLLKF